jgi:tRNA dimethylallyltransferase
MNKLLPLVVIVGPTAVGKTDVGIRLAKKANGEIISGDSMQVYKYMDIGTAKPTLEEMAGISHHLIDTLNPDDDFNVARFQAEVTQYIKAIAGKGKIPIIVGGTGLYIGSIIDHYDFTPPGEAPKKRKELLRITEKYGNERLVDMLSQVDVLAVQRIHPNDTRRLIRALEVFYATGRPISDFQHKLENKAPKYNLAYFGLTMDRQNLYRRIEQRVDIMISKGLVDEVVNLVKMGYGLKDNAMQALGYKEILDYLGGKTTVQEAINLIKRDTRRFAKRQMTWFNRDNRIKWIDVEKYASNEEIASEIVLTIEGKFSTM